MVFLGHFGFVLWLSSSILSASQLTVFAVRIWSYRADYPFRDTGD